MNLEERFKDLGIEVIPLEDPRNDSTWRKKVERRNKYKSFYRIRDKILIKYIRLKRKIKWLRNQIR